MIMSDSGEVNFALRRLAVQKIMTQWTFDEAGGVSRRARERISGVEAP
jgi:hypothetical protein